MTADETDSRDGIIAAGNWLIDHVKTIDVWPPQDGLANILEVTRGNGGGPYNLLKDLVKLGASYPLEGVGLLGDDADGRLIREDCAKHGINTDQLRSTDQARTSYTDVMTDVTTGRRTFFHDRGANALLGPTHFDFRRTRARWFYLGYLLLLDGLDAPDTLGLPQACHVFREARRHGLLTALDCVSAPGDRHRRVILPVLPDVDVLFANEHEAATLVGASVDPASREAMAQSARELIGVGVRRAAIVHSPSGACAASRNGEVVWQPAVRVPSSLIRGTAGAGDAFAAGVLHALHQGGSIPEALQLGACAAATSLLAPTCSDSVLHAKEALEFGRRHGFIAG